MHDWNLIDGFAGYRVLYWNSFLFINSKIAPLPSCFHVTVLEFRSYSHFSFVCNFSPLPSLEACRSFTICPSLLKYRDGVPCVGRFSSTVLHIQRVPSFWYLGVFSSGNTLWHYCAEVFSLAFPYFVFLEVLLSRTWLSWAKVVIILIPFSSSSSSFLCSSFSAFFLGGVFLFSIQGDDFSLT